MFILFSSVVYSLEPYTLNAKDLLNDESVRKCLSKISVITDKQRLQRNNNVGVIQPEERNAEGVWYYQETTKNFDKLPLMYKGRRRTMNSNETKPSSLCLFRFLRLSFSFE